MKKRFIISVLSLMIAIVTVAEIPEGYYDEAIGKSGSTLQSTLSRIINHSDPGYDSLWDIYKTTDCRDDGKVWDMYSNTTNFTFGSDQCGNYSGEGDCYNREHSIPKSWRGGSKYSDAHIVVPTDGYVNNRRSSYPFGEVGSSSYTSDNNFSKVGTCITSGYSGTVFEPNDEYKGDFARIYFYAATRYYSECGSWSGEGFSGSFPHLDEWTRVMMLRWHQLDPVSQKEIDRNDAVYATRQGNRNPFVDYPELVDLIFGSETSTPFTPGDVTPSATLELPVMDSTIDMGAVQLGGNERVASYSMSLRGSNISSPLALTVSGSSYFSLSTSQVAANDACNGVAVTIYYNPEKSGTHSATINITGGGLKQTVTVSLVGVAVEGFAAINATQVYDASFQANWVAHSHATDYELAVWTTDGGHVVEQTLIEVNFANGVPADWSTLGYTNAENNAIRLASGKNDGSVVTPALDLSTPTTLTVTCSPYKTSDNSVLYILVDGDEVAQIDCAQGEVTETIVLEPATEYSSITFEAQKSHRVYLQTVKLTAGGSSMKMLDGYPRNVGNVTQYVVSDVEPLSEYHYNVTACSNGKVLEQSNTITLTTGATDIKSVPSDMPEGLFVYAYNGEIYVDDAPLNARISCYSLDGTLCDTRIVHAPREVLRPLHRGIFVVQVVCPSGCYATRVAVL
ncbi:MAG: endonuclease [Bacteroidaceae bacterium]|nr:endonuclease [Bacteroidaceae bacterium]